MHEQKDGLTAIVEGMVSVPALTPTGTLINSRPPNDRAGGDANQSEF
jgi:hypothetical protein